MAKPRKLVGRRLQPPAPEKPAESSGKLLPPSPVYASYALWRLPSGEKVVSQSMMHIPCVGAVLLRIGPYRELQRLKESKE